MNYANGPPPSVRPFKTTVGIDSVYLQIKGINKSDVDRFCRDSVLKYGDYKKGKYQTEWKIFLAGGQPITVIYHFSSKTTTFQVGRLMNYTINGDDQHLFMQRLMCYFSDRKISISGLDYCMDIKRTCLPFLGTTRKEVKLHSSAIYYNNPYQTVFSVYDKALQMGIYSIPLLRFELRLRTKLGQWKVKDFIENRHSLVKLAFKIDEQIDRSLAIYADDTQSPFVLATHNTTQVLENFVAFLQGGRIPPINDHHKVRQSLAARDTFLTWMKARRIADPKRINTYTKGIRGAVQAEIGIDPKTFKKAVKFYEGIPNFRISTWA